MDIIKRIKSELPYIALIAVICSSSIFGINYFFELQAKRQAQIDEIVIQNEKNRPVTDYLVYNSVTPERPEVRVGEPLYWVSDVVSFEPISKTYQEVLYCDKYDGKGDRYFSFFESKSTTKDIGPKVSTWKWGGLTPLVPAECFIVSNIIVTTEAGDIKTLRLETEPVKIIN